MIGVEVFLSFFVCSEILSTCNRHGATVSASCIIFSHLKDSKSFFFVLPSTDIVLSEHSDATSLFIMCPTLVSNDEQYRESFST